MIKNNKLCCDWCGRTFRKKTHYVYYNDGTAYHHNCLKSVGGRTDLGRS